MFGIRYTLAGGTPLNLRVGPGTEHFVPEELAALTGGEWTELPESDDVCFELLCRSAQPNEILLENRNSGQIVYDPRQKTFRLLCLPAPPGKKFMLRKRVYLWRLIILYTFCGAMLKGIPVLPLHGAALKVKDGALLLCGQSGMGKTTSAGRWEKAGGEVLCDDLMLLEKCASGFTVHPMPTWSRCFESLEGEEMTFSRHEPVRAVLALKRSSDGTERIETADYAVYYSSIYCACCFFMLTLAPKLPENLQQELRQILINRAGEITDGGKKECLYADLQSDLKKTLEKFL